MNIAYSITCHEAPECIKNQVENLLYFTPNSSIVLHINLDSSRTYEEITKHEFFGRNSNNVLINPDRIRTSKNHYQLHRAHKSNLQHLHNIGIQFDYFIIEASNSLMIKHGITEHLKNFDVGIGSGKIDDYWRPLITQHQSLKNYTEKQGLKLNFNTAPIKGCHEGAFFRTPFADFVFNITEGISGFCGNNSDIANYPTEEVWIQVAVAILKSHVKDLRVTTTTTYLPWHKQLNWSPQDIIETISQDLLPKNKFSIKRIPRNINDPARQIITDIFNNFEGIQK
jgi:hypothetical protein